MCAHCTMHLPIIQYLKNDSRIILFRALAPFYYYLRQTQSRQNAYVQDIDLYRQTHMTKYQQLRIKKRNSYSIVNDLHVNIYV